MWGARRDMVILDYGIWVVWTGGFSYFSSLRHPTTLFCARCCSFYVFFSLFPVLFFGVQFHLQQITDWGFLAPSFFLSSLNFSWLPPT